MPPDPVGQLERSRAQPPRKLTWGPVPRARCSGLPLLEIDLGNATGEAPMGEMKRLLRGAKIDPPPVTPKTSVTELVDRAFLAYNGARLREAAQLFTRQLLADDVTIGVSLSGALTPAGLGMSCLIPLIEAGFIDWIVSTGANLYHDTHYALDLPLHQSRPNLDDYALRQNDVIRIYDVVFDYKTLLDI